MTHSVYRLLTVVLGLLVLDSCACAGAPVGFVECVSEALDQLQQGATQESAQLLQEALAKNDRSALAHAALGCALLLGGRIDEAESEFESATGIDGRCALAAYGRGLVFLSKGRLEQAAEYFRVAQELEPERDMSAAVEYVKALTLTGSTSWDMVGVNEDRVSKDEALSALAAVKLMSGAKYAHALAIWRELQPKAARTGFGERIGCSMTFVKSRPLAITGRPLKHLPTPAVGPVGALKTVKGTVQLRADLSRARNVRMVTFSVDDKLIGVTNRPPFESAWDTTRWPNGRHTIKVTGLDDQGAVLSEKTTQVVVRNPSVPNESVSPADDDTCGLWDRLWEQMELKPAAAAINYNLAVCAQQTRDIETAKAALERVMAADPTYPGAADRLSRLSGPPQPSAPLYRIDKGGKVVALTFDDGPKAETAALLDALKSKGVKATFFVVGKQAEQYPDILRRICEEGHEIGNHSYSHYALEYLPAEEIERDVFRCAAVVRSITGRGMRLLRPPGAHGGKKVAAVARRFGMRTVFCSANCAKVEGTTKEKVVRYVVASAKPGAVILMHNLDRVALRALPEIIDKLKTRGYEFVTL